MKNKHLYAAINLFLVHAVYTSDAHRNLQELPTVDMPTADGIEWTTTTDVEWNWDDSSVEWDDSWSDGGMQTWSTDSSSTEWSTTDWTVTTGEWSSSTT